jgi:hypothetical protein
MYEMRFVYGTCHAGIAGVYTASCELVGWGCKALCLWEFVDVGAGEEESEVVWLVQIKEGEIIDTTERIVMPKLYMTYVE